MRRAVPAVALIVAGCTSSELDSRTSSDTAELTQQTCSSPMDFQDWSPRVTNYWVGTANHVTVVVYSVPRTTISYAWGVGDGTTVGYIYRMRTIDERDQMLGAATISLAAVSHPDDGNSWVIAGATGGNPPTPTPGTTQFSAANVNRIIRTAGTGADSVNAMKNFNQP